MNDTKEKHATHTPGPWEYTLADETSSGGVYWTIEGEGTDAQLVEHTYSDDIGLDGMAERDGYEERYYVTHRAAWLALQRMHNTP